MPRMAFEAAIRRGGVGVRKASPRSARASRRPDGVPTNATARGRRFPALAPLMAEADAYPEPARTYSAPASSGLPTTRTWPTRATISIGCKPVAEAEQARRRNRAAPRRDRARTRARHGVRGHGPRRRAEDPADRFARVRAEVRARRPDRRDRRVPASAGRGDRRDPAGRARPPAAALPLGAPRDRAADALRQGGEDASVTAVSCCSTPWRASSGLAAARCASPTRGVRSTMAAAAIERRACQLCARRRGRADPHAAQGLWRHARARAGALCPPHDAGAGARGAAERRPRSRACARRRSPTTPVLRSTARSPRCARCRRPRSSGLRSSAPQSVSCPGIAVRRTASLRSPMTQASIRWRNTQRSYEWHVRRVLMDRRVKPGDDSRV